MIDFFTEPYKDELIYSAIARYHFYSGNVDYKDTIEECFGKRSMIPTFEFGGRLDYLSEELGGRYTSEMILNNHTIFPYYAPFMDKEQRDAVVEYIKFNGSNSIYTKLGIIAGSICKKSYIYYCPICANKDIERYGEAYIHREHQLQGIIVCPHDGCLLEKYSIKKLDISRIEYIRLERNLLNLEVNKMKINNYDKHLKLSKNVYYLLITNLDKVSKGDLSKRYKYFLYKKGLARETGTVKQRKLYEEFISYYGYEFLESLESNLDYDNEYNWLKVLARKSKRLSHPLRHLLLIEFLCKDIEEFFAIEVTKKDKRIKKKEYSSNDANLIKLNNYKIAVLQEMKRNEGLNRTKLREKLKKEYTYLYRYDKKWLVNNLPSKSKFISNNERVDWAQRDKYYLELLKERYKELSLSKEPIRITKGALAKTLGILANVEKKIDKLPMTEKFLGDMCESVEEFQIKRCKWAIDKCLENDEEIKLWRIQRIAAVRTNQFNKIKGKLLKYIKGKEMGETNGENAD